MFFLFLYFCVWVCVWVCVYLYVCLCMFLLVFVYMYVLSVASILAAFVLSLFSLCFSKRIRVTHHYYLPKIPCKRDDNLLGILSLERPTSFHFNQEFLSGSLSSSLLFVTSSHSILLSRQVTSFYW